MGYISNIGSMVQWFWVQRLQVRGFPPIGIVERWNGGMMG